MNKRNKILIFSFIIILIAFFSFVICFYSKNKNIANTNTSKIIETKNDIKNNIIVSPSGFAEYKETPVNITPKIEKYSIDDKFSNVTNVDIKKNIWINSYDADETSKTPYKQDGESLLLNNDAKKLLVKNNFVVVKNNNQEFFTTYENNRYDFIPSFITTDSVMHTYHLIFDHLLRVLEKDDLNKEISSLTANMKKVSEDNYEKLKGTEWENSAKINVAFFSVANKLIDDNSQTKDYVLKEVNSEIQKINVHEGIEESSIMNIGRDTSSDIKINTNTSQGTQSVGPVLEDYSQYNPRGHYTENDSLKKYFKTMMYLGRMSFRVKNVNETKSAILITNILNNSKDLSDSWNKIYEPTVFFVGKTDDINFYDYSKILNDSYKKTTLSISDILNNKDGLNTFIENAKKLEPPQINSIPVFAPGIVKESRDTQIKAFRFMGQRFTIDASIFQKLIYRDVGNKNGVIPDLPDETTRMLPKVLDIPAVMGSEDALNILKSEGEGNYYKYLENLNNLKKYISGLDKNTWTQNLYWGWMDTLNSLLIKKSEGYPSFMQNDAWNKKDLNTYISNYTELKRDTILYAKQVMAEMGGGGGPIPDFRGYVEPNPYLYAKLASLTDMTKNGLASRGILSEKDASTLDNLKTLSLNLKTISEKELNLEKITDDDYMFIKNYGGSIEHLWMNSLEDKKDPNDPYSQTLLEDNPAPIVADIATSPEGLCLEEGTGGIADIYVIVPVDGKLRLAKGSVYTHYEFVWPLNDRLTDEKWRSLLKIEKDAPKTAEWKKDFFVETK